MPNFFSGLMKAGLYTTQALINGPSSTLREMYSAQAERYRAVSELMSSLNYKPQQILARKQYWCSQTYKASGKRLRGSYQFLTVLCRSCYFIIK